MARAPVPKGNLYLTLRDHLGTILHDADFATLFPAWGHPGLPPRCLVEDTRLPRAQAQREAYVQTVGEDGFALLDAVAAANTTWTTKVCALVIGLSCHGLRVFHMARTAAAGEATPVHEEEV